MGRTGDDVWWDFGAGGLLVRLVMTTEELREVIMVAEQVLEQFE